MTSPPKWAYYWHLLQYIFGRLSRTVAPLTHTALLYGKCSVDSAFVLNQTFKKMSQRKSQNQNDKPRVTHGGLEPRASIVRSIRYFNHRMLTVLNDLCWMPWRRWVTVSLHKSTVTIPTGAVKTWSKENKARQPSALEDRWKTAPHAGASVQRENGPASLSH